MIVSHLRPGVTQRARRGRLSRPRHRRQPDGGPMPVYALGERVPDIHPDAYVHPDAVVIGPSMHRRRVHRLAARRCCGATTASSGSATAPRSRTAPSSTRRPSCHRHRRRTAPSGTSPTSRAARSRTGAWSARARSCCTTRRPHRRAGRRRRRGAQRHRGARRARWRSASRRRSGPTPSTGDAPARRRDIYIANGKRYRDRTAPHRRLTRRRADRQCGYLPRAASRALRASRFSTKRRP